MTHWGGTRGCRGFPGRRVLRRRRVVQQSGVSVWAEIARKRHNSGRTFTNRRRVTQTQERARLKDTRYVKGGTQQIAAIGPNWIKCLSWSTHLDSSLRFHILRVQSDTPVAKAQSSNIFYYQWNTNTTTVFCSLWIALLNRQQQKQPIYGFATVIFTRADVFASLYSPDGTFKLFQMTVSSLTFVMSHVTFTES